MGGLRQPRRERGEREAEGGERQDDLRRTQLRRLDSGALVCVSTEWAARAAPDKDGLGGPVGLSRRWLLISRVLDAPCLGQRQSPPSSPVIYRAANGIRCLDLASLAGCVPGGAGLTSTGDVSLLSLGQHRLTAQHSTAQHSTAHPRQPPAASSPTGVHLPFARSAFARLSSRRRWWLLATTTTAQRTRHPSPVDAPPPTSPSQAHLLSPVEIDQQHSSQRFLWTRNEDVRFCGEPGTAIGCRLLLAARRAGTLRIPEHVLNFQRIEALGKPFCSCFAPPLLPAAAHAALPPRNPVIAVATWTRAVVRVAARNRVVGHPVGLRHNKTNIHTYQQSPGLQPHNAAGPIQTWSAAHAPSQFFSAALESLELWAARCAIAGESRTRHSGPSSTLHQIMLTELVHRCAVSQERQRRHPRGLVKPRERISPKSHGTAADHPKPEKPPLNKRQPFSESSTTHVPAHPYFCRLSVRGDVTNRSTMSCNTLSEPYTKRWAFIRRLTVAMALLSERGGPSYVRIHASTAVHSTLVEYANAHNSTLEYTVYEDRFDATRVEHKSARFQHPHGDKGMAPSIVQSRVFAQLNAGYSGMPRHDAVSGANTGSSKVARAMVICGVHWCFETCVSAGGVRSEVSELRLKASTQRNCLDLVGEATRLAIFRLRTALPFQTALSTAHQAARGTLAPFTSPSLPSTPSSSVPTNLPLTTISVRSNVIAKHAMHSPSAAPSPNLPLSRAGSPSRHMLYRTAYTRL
ncbi:hypothetical protein PMIN01_12590 [Paraphaeosphaeria minitans]|uniref:Uncharacterized protein n=1 Tax=Paraphaeosphaeria minitans TaxID=565426 RepID=A0A9P6G5Z1_9PLEO|nr:hypothetical protein PMIN01_12590 [Paraphaeosphaeria minitans]